MNKTLLFAGLLLFARSAHSQDLVKSVDNAHPGGVSALFVNSEGTTILSTGADKRINMWDAKAGTKGKIMASASNVNAIAFNSNGKLFATGTADFKIYIYDAVEAKPKKIFKEHTADITSLAFNPVNDNVASGSKDNTVKIWDANAPLSLKTFREHSKTVTAVIYSPDGKVLVSGSEDKTIKIWDIETGTAKTTIDAGKEVLCLAYASDGSVIAAGHPDGSVSLWDPITGRKKNELTDLKSQVNAVSFTPDVQYLIAGGKDNLVAVWNLELMQLSKSTPAHSNGITSITLSDKGSIMATGGNDGALKIWDLSALKVGKKKAVKEEFEPQLVCSPLTLKEANNNGILEATDNPSLTFSIDNKGKGRAYGLTAKVSLENFIKGITIEKETSIGNLDVGKTVNVEIPVKAGENLESEAGVFIVTISEANGHNPPPLRLNFQTKGAVSYSYIAVLEHSYTSASGKAEIGAPITMKMKLKNAAESEGKNIKISYIFPPQVKAVDKLSEVIPSIPAGEIKEISVQFYADKEFKGQELKIAMNIEGAFSNTNDMIFAIKMNEPLPSSIVLAAVSADEVKETLYRGSGDPLKGLNVSKAKTMSIGKYYAMIVGVDKYKGSWTPLKNAVNDARAIEAMLKAKYKFDHFKSLYDDQATREAIITEFEWLVANVKENDNLFIYYSGHGEYKQELNKGFWVPIDATTVSVSKYISNSDIQTFLNGIKSKHTLLVADACFSGDIFRGNTVSIPFEDSEKYYTEVYNQASRQALTSGGIEPVMDGGKDGHSVFAYYFLKALENNNNKYLDAGNLYNQIKIPIINNSEQTPKIAPIKNTGDEGGQFIFMKK
ncbi:MAG: caspase family protein [Bacteroidetes bacterium]|nr:caspase family protein [Bacteroidota bacterium]